MAVLAHMWWLAEKGGWYGLRTLSTRGRGGSSHNPDSMDWIPRHRFAADSGALKRKTVSFCAVWAQISGYFAFVVGSYAWRCWS